MQRVQAASRASIITPAFPIKLRKLHLHCPCFLIPGALAMLALSSARADLTVPSAAPFYTSDSIVHAATQIAGALAPNTIATIYGTNLSFTTHGVTADDLENGTLLPTSLDGVHVIVYGIPCSLYYVSPGQINFLIPYEVTQTSVPLYVIRQGVSGPAVTLRLAPSAPGFFGWGANVAVAQHADGSLIAPDTPAHSGEIIVVYAAGLGRTSPDIASGQIVTRATYIANLSQFDVTINGNPVPQDNIYYAGLTPGLAGLYQINLRLPDPVPPNPEIRITMGASASPASVYLPAQ